MATMCSRFAVLLIASLLLQEGAAQDRPKYLIISVPALHKVIYSKLSDSTSGPPASEPLALIDAGLKMPQGLAVDQKNSRLFVADPELEKILCYKLVFSGDLLLVEGEPSVAVEGTQARWIAVDDTGALFLTDEVKSQIQRVSYDKMLRGKESVPTIIYDSATNGHVSAPGGIALDNFHVYWTNKAAGDEVGSLIKGFEKPKGVSVQGGVTVLGRNAKKVYGVCLSANNIFYTDDEKAVFAVKKKGSAIATVSDKFLEPRGCVWDGDGTVYIADKKAGTVSSIAGNMHNLAPSAVTLTVQAEGAFGVAVVSGAEEESFWSYISRTVR